MWSDGSFDLYEKLTGIEFLSVVLYEELGFENEVARMDHYSLSWLWFCI